ncbi:MAG: outer membrane beta-barrel protein [Candidatus Aminicenantes bacterium]
MNKKTIISSMVIFLLLVGTQDMVRGERLIFHVNGGISLPAEENVNSAFDSGFGFAVAVNKKLWFSFNFDYWRSQVKETEKKLLEGKLSETPFLASVHYSLTESKTFNPYVFAGIGFVFSHFDIGEYVTIPEVTINQKVENGPALQAGLGGWFRVSKRWAVFAEALYLYRKTDGKTIITDLNLGVTEDSFSLNMSASLLRVGIRYFL